MLRSWYIKGKRGQAFLKELLKVLDAMPVKELIDDEMEWNNNFSALGAVGKSRGLDMRNMNSENEHYDVAQKLNITRSLAREIMYVNDDDCTYSEETGPQSLKNERWQRVRRWVADQITTGGE
jgi:hypothetical protein